MSYPFVFDIPKAIQAVGVLLRSSMGRRMNYLRLLKLLYIADRESLHDKGRPITGSRAVAMPRGPVPTAVTNFIRGPHVEMPRWNKYFRVDGYEIGRTDAEPDIGELTRYELEKLEEIIRRYRDKDEWAMVQETHKFPEWIKNDPGESSRPLSLEDILAAVGRSQDSGARVQEEQQQATFDRIFNTPPKNLHGCPH